MTSPTPPSLTALLEAAHEALKEYSINASLLGVAIVGPTECYFGEISRLGELRGLTFEEMVAIRDPKRISRVMSVGGGRVNVDIPFSDFDMVLHGTIHVRPLGGGRAEPAQLPARLPRVPRREETGISQGSRHPPARRGVVHVGREAPHR
jgi:hypothetical protein